MKISIVTLSYNQGSFLEQCILSVIRQAYPEIEYIIVDPGSSDGSRDIIERYSDRITKIIFESDHGPADGLNKGFKHATGDVFGFLNADDYYLSDSLGSLMSTFRSHPQWDVVSGDALVVDVEGKPLRRLYSRKFSPLRAAYGAATLAQQATFFRSEAFHKVGGFNLDNQFAWDGELWIDMALSGARFGRLDKLLAAFRLHAENITFSNHAGLTYQQYLDRMFRKVRGRDRSRLDVAITIAMKVLEYTENPRIVIERLLRGPALQRRRE
jgi:glycosyltransferase involved in cell wall biosynthesis